MPSREPDTRPITLVDIPLVKRLSDKGIILDTELGLTGYALAPNTTLLSSIFLPQRGLHTFVARSDKQTVVGQFRLKADDPNAHIVYVAPCLEDDAENTVWLHILDAMARESGRHGAHSLIAEVEEQSSLFTTLRAAGFAVYARQEIWRRERGEYILEADSVELTPETNTDAPGMYALLAAVVPGMLQQIAGPPNDLQRLVYRQDDRIMGFIAVSEGRHGVYLIPYLHPDMSRAAPAVLQAAVAYTSRATKVPVYVCIRRYQDWLQSALTTLQFESWLHQAVMVKHITAGVRHAEFEPLRQSEGVRSPIPPPNRYSSIVETHYQEYESNPNGTPDYR